MRYLGARREAIGPDVATLLEQADKISHLSTLTLIYQNISPDPHSNSKFSQECMETALLTLTEHEKCLPILKRVNEIVFESYIQWLGCSTTSHVCR